MKINCKKCNAPLLQLGNLARSRHLVCEYCGTVMDVRNEFKALYSFTHIQKDSKFRIGQILNFQKIEFEVTGLITYQAQEKQWIQYQLFSITHGYAKLIIKEQKTIFLRRTHYLPKPNIWLLRPDDSFTLQSQQFTITAFEFSEIYYAAGSLLDDISEKKRSKQCFAKSKDSWFQSTFKRDSVEFYLGYEYHV